jgi:S-adenosyl-L-methionine hydrolase (adenosine-forming)
MKIRTSGPDMFAQRTFLTIVALLFSFLIATAVCGAAQAAPAQSPRLVFMTDFGVLDDSVAICKGVMYSIDPDLRIVDLTHQVTPYSILDGARYLFGATPYYPAGTVFVVVIDPGVGSSRKAVIVKSKRGQYFVLPDNGLITLVADRDGLEDAREITNRDWMIGSALSSTFHGRDIFSPVGAHLARGDDWTQVGPELPPDKLVRLDLQPVRTDNSGVHGAVIATDGPFGNLVTNIDGSELLKLGYHHGDKLHVTVGTTELDLPFVRTFSDVPLNTPLLYIDSRGRVGLAVNQGSFVSAYRIKPPAQFLIARPKQ